MMQSFFCQTITNCIDHCKKQLGPSSSFAIYTLKKQYILNITVRVHFHLVVYVLFSDEIYLYLQDTEEVRKAKEIFFEAYRKQLELVSEEEDDDDSDEESSESDEDDESSEESDEDDSSEESSEEDSEEDDDEDEDHEGQAEEDLKVQEFLRRGKDNRPAQESIFFKPAAHKFNKVSRSHRSPSSRSIRNSYKRQQN